MTTQFKILFTVNIAHRYYNTGCKDFDFVFPADTAQLFRNGKLLAKVREGVLYVLFEADEAGLAPLISIEGKKLRIGLKLLNPFFANFTDLALKVNEEILLYKNAGSANNLSPAETVLALDYADTELLQLGIFGVIEIDVATTFYNTEAPNFKITFGAKEETLKYYVIAKNYTDGEFNQLSVADVGFTADLRPQVLFTKVASTAFTANEISPALLLGSGGGKLALFQSQGVVRQENARKKIQLSNNGNVLVTHLPQPSTNRPNSDLIINVSKP